MYNVVPCCRARIRFLMLADIDFKINPVYRSNINDWYRCEPVEGSLVRNKTDGSIKCLHIGENVGNCTNTKTDTPTKIVWEDTGPVLKGTAAIYRFDGFTSKAVPVHNSCVYNKDNNSTRNHKTGVENPYGQIFIK